jgi:hypothetical protein
MVKFDVTFEDLSGSIRIMPIDAVSVPNAADKARATGNVLSLISIYPVYAW